MFVPRAARSTRKSPWCIRATVCASAERCALLPCDGSSGSPRDSSYEGAFDSMAIPATQLRPGMVIKHNNDLHSVFSVEHRTPGNLRAFIQAKLRNLRTGAMFEH